LLGLGLVVPTLT